MTSFPQRFRVPAVGLVLVVAAYMPALRGTLLWDDSSHVTAPGLQSLHGLWRIWFDLGATQQYYPLLHSAFWLEHRLWGDQVFGYHLVNVLLHALCAWLVYCIVRRLRLPGAWIAALLFALHPIAVESVAWISEQKSTLSGAFYLGALLTYLSFDETRRRSRYWLALALFVCALLSKTVTATLPAALLVIFWWQRGRIDWRKDVTPLAPWLGIGAAAGLFTAWVERTYIGAQGAGFELSAVDRFLLAGRALCFYAMSLVWPSRLTFFYPRWKIDAGVWWQWCYPVAVIALAGLLVWVARRYRGPLAALLLYTGTLFPVLGFLNIYPFRYTFVADHFQYLACLAILIPAAVVFAATPGRGTAAFPAIAIAALWMLTWHQAAQYRDAETLYRATVERNPDAWLAHNNLANLLLETPARRGEAIEHLQAALRIKPDFPEAHLTLGNALLTTPGRLADAVQEYRTAVTLDPSSDRAHANLGNALLDAGEVAPAVAELQTALRLRPDNALAHNTLGNAYSQMPGRLADALAEYQAAVGLNAGFAEAHNNLGRALAQSGRLPDAVAEFQMALRLRPDYANAHSNLGNAYSMMPGRLADAVSEYQSALRINPDFLQARFNMGNALAQMPGRLPEAIEAYRAVIERDPRNLGAHYNLARAYQSAGKTSEARAEMAEVEKLRR